MKSNTAIVPRVPPSLCLIVLIFSWAGGAMNHTSRICLAALISMLCGPALSPANAARPETPNLVFIMVDDLGPEWVSCYGAEEIRTPCLDELARTGMLFQNAYSMPQCTPTRVTLLTGQYPFRHGWVNHWDVPRWGAGCSFDWKHNVTFATQLKQAGYATGIAGKWQINDFRVQPDALRKHGFDEWCVWTGFETGNEPSAERYWDPYLFQNVEIPGFGWPTANVRQDGEHGTTGTYPGAFGPDVESAFSLDFVTRHRDRPFLLYYPMTLTHAPFVHTPDEPEATTVLEKHKAMVRHADKLVGRLIHRLEELGLRERTIVVFSTDNGTAGSITGRLDGRSVQGGKASVRETGTRPPFLVSAPGIVPRGVTTECLVDFSDLLPTFCELAGAPLPKDVPLDGRSFAPVILGEREDGGRQWILAMGHGPARLDEQGVRPVQDFAHRVIRDQRYKVHVSEHREITALHDLRTDPGEQRNLIASQQPSHVRAVEKFTAVLETLPARDGRPRYTPTPPRPWDAKKSE